MKGEEMRERNAGRGAGERKNEEQAKMRDGEQANEERFSYEMRTRWASECGENPRERVGQ